MERKFLLLKLNEQTFAVDLKYAREIIPYSQPTKLPQAPYFFDGLIHLRGFFLPLINTKRLLGLEDGIEKAFKKIKILIIAVKKKIIGIKTDDIEDILRVEEDKILPAPSLISNLQHNYFSGGFYLNGRVIMILDVERLFVEHVLPNNNRLKETKI